MQQSQGHGTFIYRHNSVTNFRKGTYAAQQYQMNAGRAPSVDTKGSPGVGLAHTLSYFNIQVVAARRGAALVGGSWMVHGTNVYTHGWAYFLSPPTEM